MAAMYTETLVSRRMYYNLFDHNTSMSWSHFVNFTTFTVSMT